MAVMKEAELLEAIVDAGESAKSLNRLGMARLLDLVDRRAVDVVIIAKLDRLTRSVADLADVRVESVDRRYPIGEPEIVRFVTTIDRKPVAYVLHYVYDTRRLRVVWKTPAGAAHPFAEVRRSRRRAAGRARWNTRSPSRRRTRACTRARWKTASPMPARCR